MTTQTAAVKPRAFRFDPEVIRTVINDVELFSKVVEWARDL